MEKILVWDRIRSRIPSGLYYKRTAIPRKESGYEIIIDTEKINANCYVKVNGDLIHTKSDNSGLVRLNVKLNIGTNTIEYRFEAEIGYKSFQIEVTNESVLSYGAARAGIEGLDNVRKVFENCFAETAEDTHKFKFLVDYDKLDDKYKYKEILEGSVIWVSKFRAVRILGNVEEANITGFVGRLRGWICNVNSIVGGNFSSIRAKDLDRYFKADMFYGGELSLVKDDVLFDRVLQYRGSGLGKIYADCAYWDDALRTDWSIEVFVRANVSIEGGACKIGVGWEKENRWIWYNLGIVDETWRRYNYIVSEVVAPDVCVISIPTMGLSTNWIRIGEWRVKRDRWRVTPKFVVGSYRPVKSVGVEVGAER